MKKLTQPIKIIIMTILIQLFIACGFFTYKYFKLQKEVTIQTASILQLKSDMQNIKTGEDLTRIYLKYFGGENERR